MSEFYKNLDAFNLIIFWSVAIIIFLLLVFAIIITNKNRKLKKIISTNARMKSSNLENNSQEYRDIPLDNDEIIVKKVEPVTETKQEEISKEEKFVPEEHIIAYDNNLFTLPNIEKNTAIKPAPKPNPKEIKTEVGTKKDTFGPYQKNTLRDAYANQTSPIGISRAPETVVEEKDAHELSEVLNQESQNKTYLDEVSKKLSDAKNNEELERTAYELAEEENAIISYNELMKRKDELKMVDEEESVISVQELMEKKARDKLYNITDNDTNDEFINELKNFRNDL